MSQLYHLKELLRKRKHLIHSLPALVRVTQTEVMNLQKKGKNKQPLKKGLKGVDTFS